MPEHVHFLVSEPARGNVPKVVQVLKQRVARRLLPRKKPRGQGELWVQTERRRFWQRRYYDFNVYSERKVGEKLHYMHWNPVKRGLVGAPELWHWSSYRAFVRGEKGVVELNWQQPPAEVPNRDRNATVIAAHPRKHREGRAPTLWIEEQTPKAKAKGAE